MTAVTLSPVLAGLGLGVALASAPGPVQAVLLAESVRGGVGRGLRALAGANFTFGLLLVSLALGLSVAPPSGPALRVLKVVGGVLLIWLAVDGIRSAHEAVRAASERRALPPAARGALAVLVNPGAWLFLGAVASPLLGSATQLGGRGTAVFAALALMAGAGVGDVGVVLLGGLGVRRAGQRVQLWVRRGLGTVLAGLGVWLLTQGVMGT
ncbi:MAG: LysE family transporter [Actinomycetota bacterium]|nr:LysE family transporter [Actinomycetota bacterium]